MARMGLLIGGLLLLAALFALPALAGEYVLLVVILVYINVLLAATMRVSLNAGLLNVAVPAFMAIGAYGSSLLAMKLGVPTPLSFIGGGLLAALVSLAIGLPSLNLKGVYFLTLTWGFLEVTRATATKWVSLTGGTAGLIGVPPLSLGGFAFADKVSQYYLTLVVSLVILFVLWRLENSRFGLVWKGIRQTEGLGKAVGINTFGYKVVAFTLSCFFAGLTGALYAHTMQYLTPVTFSVTLAFNVMIFCYIGGLGTFTGAIVGAVFLSVLTEPLRGFAAYERIFYSVAVILAILFLPGGLMSLPSRLTGIVDRLKRLGKPAPSRDSPGPLPER